ncbi:MAG: hypothetical protein J6D23_04065 [Clostridia bacterium]|nr:hypothetical protein [Clostridia bacterium]
MAEYKRVPLTVNAVFMTDGTIKPKKIITANDVFNIDRIVDIKRYCPRVVSCVAPIQYTVIVEGIEKKIYFEPHSNMWFSVKLYEG